jgi:hypothetical protein
MNQIKSLFFLRCFPFSLPGGNPIQSDCVRKKERKKRKKKERKERKKKKKKKERKKEKC